MKNRPSASADLRFLDHLEILRGKIIPVVLWFLLLSVFFFVFGEKLLSYLTAPLKELSVSLVYIKPQEKVISYLKAAFLAGFLVSFPLLVLQVASFVYPALTKGERSGFFLVVGSMLLFFAAGTVFAYLILLPFACTFFFSFAAGDGIQPVWSIGAYVSLASSLIVLIGAVFQLPLPLLFLVRAGFLEPKALKKYRKHAAVMAFLAAAFLTPPDIFTQAVVGTTLYLLFETTLLLARFIFRKTKENDPWIDGNSSES